MSTLLSDLKKAHFKTPLSFKSSPLATDEQILLAHSKKHLSYIKASAPLTGKQALDSDTIMSSDSLDATLRGVGAACMAIDDLFTSELNNAFCATRPPGHHATHDHAMGFCIFNNIAVAALYAQQKYSLNRVVIIDFDVHHGNGTQDIMSGKTGVLYISLHQSPLYPGTGAIKENISGNIINIPLAAGTSHLAYIESFKALVLPAIEAFKPELILVSAGFDAHQDDPLARANLSLAWS